MIALIHQSVFFFLIHFILQRNVGDTEDHIMIILQLPPELIG